MCFGTNPDDCVYEATPSSCPDEEEEDEDDGPALQWAIDHAVNGDIIYIPAGIYDIKQPIVAPHGVSIVGDGMAVAGTSDCTVSAGTKINVRPSFPPGSSLLTLAAGRSRLQNLTVESNLEVGPDTLVRAKPISDDAKQGVFIEGVEFLVAPKSSTKGLIVTDAEDVYVRNNRFVAGGGFGAGRVAQEFAYDNEFVGNVDLGSPNSVGIRATHRRR